MDNFAGTMFKTTTTAGVTVRLAVPVKDPAVTPIVAVPTALARAAPAELTLAIADADELHVAVFVRFCVLPLLYVPVAVNCCVSPAAIEELAGVTATEARTGEVTVSMAAPCTVPAVAVIVVLPTIMPLARAAALIVATEGADELHVTDAVKACVLRSLYVPVAANCCVSPAAIEDLTGVTVTEARTGEVTVSTAAPCMLPEAAVIVVLPTIMPLARPAALIVATVGADELHVTDAVKACVLPSLYVPVAENCSGRPAGTVPFAGVTPMDTSAAGPTVTDVLPLTP
jgi:hypothetical protein